MFLKDLNCGTDTCQNFPAKVIAVYQIIDKDGRPKFEIGAKPTGATVLAKSGYLSTEPMVGLHRYDEFYSETDNMFAYTNGFYPSQFHACQLRDHLSFRYKFVRTLGWAFEPVEIPVNLPIYSVILVEVEDDVTSSSGPESTTKSGVSTTSSEASSTSSSSATTLRTSSEGTTSSGAPESSETSPSVSTPITPEASTRSTSSKPDSTVTTSRRISSEATSTSSESSSPTSTSPTTSEAPNSSSSGTSEASPPSTSSRTTPKQPSSASTTSSEASSTTTKPTTISEAPSTSTSTSPPPTTAPSTSTTAPPTTTITTTESITSSEVPTTTTTTTPPPTTSDPFTYLPASPLYLFQPYPNITRSVTLFSTGGDLRIFPQLQNMRRINRTNACVYSNTVDRAVLEGCGRTLTLIQWINLVKGFLYMSMSNSGITPTGTITWVGEMGYAFVSDENSCGLPLVPIREFYKNNTGYNVIAGDDVSELTKLGYAATGRILGYGLDCSYMVNGTIPTKLNV